MSYLSHLVLKHYCLGFFFLGFSYIKTIPIHFFIIILFVIDKINVFFDKIDTFVWPKVKTDDRAASHLLTMNYKHSLNVSYLCPTLWIIISVSLCITDFFKNITFRHIHTCWEAFNPLTTLTSTWVTEAWLKTMLHSGRSRSALRYSMYWALKYKQAQQDTVSEANPPKQLKA